MQVGKWCTEGALGRCYWNPHATEAVLAFIASLCDLTSIFEAVDLSSMLLQRSLVSFYHVPEMYSDLKITE